MMPVELGKLTIQVDRVDQISSQANKQTNRVTLNCTNK